MRRALVIPAALGATLAAVPPAPAITPVGPRYEGRVEVVGREGTGVRRAAQGAGWTAVFRERARGRVRYRVCLRHLGNGVRRCYERRSTDAGRSRVFVALFVNDRGGPGRWEATWSVRGRRVATWRFRVDPEFEP